LIPDSSYVTAPRAADIDKFHGSQWSPWADVDFSKAVTVPFPGFIKFRAYQKANVQVFNFKSPDEADSLVGLTVVLGQYGVV
jgi:hypothetical protein